MRKLVAAILIISTIIGIIIDIIINWKIKQGISMSDCYLSNVHCIQTVLWIIFSVTSGLTLLFDPQPVFEFLVKVAPWKAKKFSVQLLGFFLLASLPLSIYSLIHDCKTSCIPF